MPDDLEIEVAKQLDCILPPKRTHFKKRDSRLISFIPIHESIEFDDEDDVFGTPREAEVISIDLEELEDAFDHFLYKLDNLV